ncbi:tRNA (guanosine(37)-N1)-methyltransferase TrmD [Acidaminobacter sp. JC074]|uniref:tRNA (guanosine(37)-N1)-methyltransferase TrmD n=1 Tax=Acidaminobacter sp. JC074 TaxID=2530199 RepID=UPI001F0FA69C|nr:tRNA (guanosine(37)-N1)-methyltransferase TrmD [Acidaminobacter sp. JC074]MCH4888704.1 tRNA (guanosine(37)-N1)-methyltransferase TrmD [Acidaminobacter sp. JC074]
MKFHVLTLFPEMFETMNHSIMKRAQDQSLISLNVINIRDFSTNKHKKVDDYPYGGGAGMVMQVQPIADALETTSGRVIYMTPKGRVFDQVFAKELALEEEIVFLCGHYEGVDQRVIDKYVTDEVSIGDFVLTGGELPAMVMMDAVARLKDGVLGQNVSYEDESHYNGLLEYPHYTRPADYEGMKVPDVLLSGNHQKIEDFRLEESIKLTASRRPDMIKKYAKRDLSKKEMKILKKYLDK